MARKDSKQGIPETTRQEKFCSGTGTIGVAQSLYLTFSMTPNYCKQVRSFSIASQSTYGAVRALQNFSFSSDLQQVLPVAIIPSSSYCAWMLKDYTYLLKKFKESEKHHSLRITTALLTTITT